MGNNNFANLISGLKTTVSKHAPEILMGFGITGMLTSTVLAVKSTPKALALLDVEEHKKGEKLTPVEMIKATWKCYIPAASVGAVSVCCLLGASTISGKRNAALATAYTLVDTAHKEYKEKVIETIGEEKEKEIKDKIAEEKIRKNPVENNQIFMTGDGDTLCYDALSGRYFRSNVNRINEVINKLNRNINISLYVSLNDFYEEVGLDENEMGRELGWNHNTGLIEVYFSSQLSPKKEPCLVISFDTPPQYNYQSLY